jgi:hypothetical protein
LRRTFGQRLARANSQCDGSDSNAASRLA